MERQLLVLFSGHGREGVRMLSRKASRRRENRRSAAFCSCTCSEQHPPECAPTKGGGDTHTRIVAGTTRTVRDLWQLEKIYLCLSPSLPPSLSPRPSPSLAHPKMSRRPMNMFLSSATSAPAPPPTALLNVFPVTVAGFGDCPHVKLLLEGLAARLFPAVCLSIVWLI